MIESEKLENIVKKLIGNGYKQSLLKIIEIEKDPRNYVIHTGYHQIDNGAYLKNPEAFLNTFGWKAEDVGLNSAQIRKLKELGIIKNGYHSKRHKWYRLNISVDELEKTIEQIDSQKKTEIEIPPDLFDCIVGHDDTKWLLRKILESEKPVHHLLIGPPASGKSLILLEISRIPGAKYYAAGGTITKAGLIDLLFEEEPKILIIDEIEKADKKDLSVLLSLMESGIVTKLVHGQELRLKLNTKVFAAANTLKNLPSELVSRFMIMEFDEYSEDEFVKVAKSVLIKREGLKEDLAEYIANEVVKYSRNVRDAIAIGRLAKNKEDVDRILEITLKRKYKIF